MERLKTEKNSEKLYRDLKEKILTLKPGTKIKSLRVLEAEYNLNLNIVLKIIKKLKEEGYIYSEKGKGYFIKERSNFSIYKNEKEEITNHQLMREVIKKEGVINFNAFIPKQDKNFTEQYKKVLRKVLRTTDQDIFLVHEIQGLSSLIELIGNLIERGNSLFIKKENIIVTSNLSTAYMMISKVFSKARNKPIIAMTNPSFPKNYNLLKFNFNIKFFDLQKNGWNLTLFEEFLKKERIAFVDITTTYHIPTGITWSENKKLKLLKLAEKYDFYILENDSYSDFFYYRRKNAIKSLERAGKERVIYLKSHSGYLSPEFELALMIVPPTLREKIIYAKYYIDENTPIIKQRALEELLKTGVYENYFKKKKKELKTKYEKILEFLSENKEFQLSRKPDGGFFIWLTLPKYIDINQYYKRCEQEGVLLILGSSFYFQGQTKNEIGINFFAPDLDEVIEGINIMKKIFEELKIIIDN